MLGQTPRTTRAARMGAWSVLTRAPRGADLRPLLGGLGLLGLGSCVLLEQYPDLAPDPVTTTGTTTSAGGGTGTTSTATASGGGGQGGSAPTTSTTTSTTGTGGAGGAGGGITTTTTTTTTGAGGAGGGSGCAPQSTMPCYSGPPLTRNVGACKEGVSTCTAQGVFGPCMGEVLPGQEDCATPADEDCDGLSPPCPIGTPLWGKAFGDSDNQAGTGIAAWGDGNVVIAGGYVGKVDFGGGTLPSQGPSDAYLARFGPNGEHVWSKRFGDLGTEAVAGIVTGATGQIAIAGQYTSPINFGQGPLLTAGQNDIFVASFNAQGGILWGNGYGNAQNQIATGIAGNAQGDLLMGGRLDGIIDFGLGPLIGAGQGDALAARFTSTGTPLWGNKYGDGQTQQVVAVALDPAGNMLAAGLYKGVLDFGLGASPNAAQNRMFLAKLDPTGAPLYNLWFGGVFSVLVPRAMVTDAASNVILLGRINGSADFGGGQVSSVDVMDNLFLVKLDPQGNFLWGKVFGGAATVADGGLAVDPFGNIVITGGFYANLTLGGPTLVSAGGEDLFVAKLDPMGNHLWSQSLGDPSGQRGQGVAVDALGSIFVTGLLNGTIDVAGNPVTSAGGSDILLLRFAP